MSLFQRPLLHVPNSLTRLAIGLMSLRELWDRLPSLSVFSHPPVAWTAPPEDAAASRG